MTPDRSEVVAFPVWRFVAAVALVILTVGCSSPGGDAAQTSSSTTSGTARVTTVTNGSTPRPTTTVAGGAPGSVPVPTAPPSGTHQQFCDGVVAAEEQLARLDPQKTTPDQYLAQAKKVFADATADAPSDLKPDMATVDAYVQATTSIDELGGSLPPSIAPAATRVQSWFAVNCHLDLRIG